MVIDHLPAGDTLVCISDNTAAVAWINAGGAAAPGVNAIIAPLRRIAQATGVRVRAVHWSGTFMDSLGPDTASRRRLAHARRMRSPADDPQQWRDDWRTVDILQLTQEDAAEHPGPRSALACSVCSSCLARHAGPGDTCVACVHWQVFGADVAAPGMSKLAPLLTTLLPHRRPQSTSATYESGMRRFIALVQRFARQDNVILHSTDIIPTERDRPIALHHMLAFLVAARGQYASSTIEQTLSAVTDWQRHRSHGRTTGFADSYVVRNTLEAVKRSHAGTPLGNPQAAFPIPAAVVAYLVQQLVADAEALVNSGDTQSAYGVSRDAWYCAIAFAACLRQSEAVAVRAQHIFQHATAGWCLFIPFSKTDPYGSGSVLPIPAVTAAGIPVLRTLQLLRRITAARGCRTPILCGHMHRPDQPLADASTIVRRLNEYHLPSLAHVTWPEHVRITGHSFRRGGINHLRDSLRTHNVHEDMIRATLMRVGRWRDPASLAVYLVEDYATLARTVHLA